MLGLLSWVLAGDLHDPKWVVEQAIAERMQIPLEDIEVHPRNTQEASISDHQRHKASVWWKQAKSDIALLR